jgi:hypothetical protein
MAALTPNRLNIEADTDHVLYNGSGCTSFDVTVPTTSPYGVKVNVSGLHQAGEGFCVASGASRIFRNLHGQITSVIAQGDGGTATNVTYGVVSQTSSVAHFV